MIKNIGRIFIGLCLWTLASCSQPAPELPHFDIQAADPVSLQPPFSFKNLSVVGFAQQDTQVVLTDVQIGTKRPLYWWNRKTNHLDRSLLNLVFPVGETIIDTIVAPEGSVLFLTQPSSGNAVKIYRVDPTGTDPQPVPIRNIEPPMNAYFADTHFGSATWLISRLAPNMAFWVGSVDGKTTLSTPMLWNHKVVVSPDHMHLVAFDLYAHTIEKWKLPDLSPEILPVSASWVDVNFQGAVFLSDGRLGVVSQNNNGPSSQANLAEWRILDDHLQVAKQTTWPLPRYIGPSPDASPFETVFSIRSATQSPLVAIVAGKYDSYLSFWDESEQRLQATPVGAHRDPIMRIAPVGSTGLLTIGKTKTSGSSLFFQWQWTKDNTLRRVYNASEYLQVPLESPLTVMDSIHTGMIVGDTFSHTVKIFQATTEEEIPLSPISVNFLTLKVGCLSKTVPHFAGRADDIFWAWHDKGTLMKRTTITGTVFQEASSTPPLTPSFHATFSPSGQCVASVSDEGVRSACATSSFAESPDQSKSIPWTQKSMWTDLQGTIDHLEWSPGGEWVFGSNLEGDAVLWGVFTDTALQYRLLQQQSPVVGAGWLDTHVVATVQQDGTLTLWSALDGTVLQQQSLMHTYKSASFVNTPTGAVAMMLLADGWSVQRVFLDRTVL